VTTPIVTTPVSTTPSPDVTADAGGPPSSGPVPDPGVGGSSSGSSGSGSSGSGSSGSGSSGSGSSGSGSSGSGSSGSGSGGSGSGGSGSGGSGSGGSGSGGSGSGGSGVTFYVSPSGSDSNPGTESLPWRTVGRVNEASLAAGDSVLFQGGAVFSDSALMPAVSGVSGDPITFGSYGSGQAELDVSSANDVWLPDGVHDLTFEDLDFTGGSVLFASSGGGSGTYDITVTGSTFSGTPLSAINIANPGDSDWTVSDDTISDTGDSGIIIWGSDVSVTGCTISDTGTNSALDYGKHGIYDKGPDTTIADNDISDIPNGEAISLRFHGAQVYGNTIHDTPYAIAFFDYDTSSPPQGTSYVYDNRLWDISGYGFYYDNQADPNGNSPSVNFVLANNTFEFSGGEAVDLSVVPSSATVTLVNNIFTGSFGSEYRGCASCSEYSNDWYGGSENFASGSGDIFTDPDLSAAPTLAPASGSPVINTASSNVPGLSLGQRDIGAV
jgi:hypothetical protein